jgi:hypothetical protein
MSGGKKVKIVFRLRCACLQQPCEAPFLGSHASDIHPMNFWLEFQESIAGLFKQFVSRRKSLVKRVFNLNTLNASGPRDRV